MSDSRPPNPWNQDHWLVSPFRRVTLGSQPRPSRARLIEAAACLWSAAPDGRYRRPTRVPEISSSAARTALILEWRPPPLSSTLPATSAVARRKVGLTAASPHAQARVCQPAP